MASNKPKFTFESEGLDKDTFSVVKFKGTEGLSTLYSFDITLISKTANPDIDTVLENPAVFTIRRDDGDIPFNGILSSFEQLQQAGGYVFYRVRLVPKLWWTTLTQHNQIFLHDNVQEFLEQVLVDAGMRQGLDFDFKLQKSYPAWEYICQYGESHFNFASRWMERDGLYYYFDQTQGSEKMVITDTHISHSPMPEGTAVIYSQLSNLDHTHREEVVKNFMLKQRPLPNKVRVKDYNYRKPGLEMMSEAVVSSRGLGEIYYYGEHFRTPEEGEALAQVRADEYLCRAKVFHGVSTVPYIRTGYIFELKDHYRQDFNQRYLTTEVTHEGSQEAYLTSGLNLRLSKNADRLYYRNSFSCIPADVQYRAERKAVKPKFHGSMNATVDASGSGKYAELDEQGRYKVILPLDVSGRKDGKATTWLRMAQPYAGSDHGMHFPLHKGTEVLLTCIDGDPDRPIIQSAVPNPETPSLVNSNNQTQCQITTGGQNRIHFEDATGGERILMTTPKSNTWLRMGTPNDPPSLAEGESSDSDDDSDSGDSGTWSSEGEGGEAQSGVKLNTEAHIEVFAGSEATTLIGNSFELVGGSAEGINVGNKTDVLIGVGEDICLGGKTEIDVLEKLGFRTEKTDLEAEVTKLQGEVTKLQGAQSTIAGEVTALKGTHTKLAGEVTKLEGEHTALKGEVTNLEGEHTSLKGEVTKLEGEQTTLSGEVTTLKGTQTSLAGEMTSLKGEVTEIDGAVTKMGGEVTAMSGSVTRLDGETTSLAGSIAQIVGMKTVI